MVGFMPCAEGDEDEFLEEVAIFMGEVEGISWSMSMFSGVGGRCCSSREEIEEEEVMSGVGGPDSLDFEPSLKAVDDLLLPGAFAPNQVQTAFIVRSLHPKKASGLCVVSLQVEWNRI